MTRTLLVAGTASHVGKSTVVAGLCRHLADRGVSVAPFKAQNMSNNARVVLRSRDGPRGDCSDSAWTAGADPSDRWGEIGVSQFVQARAARITPTTDCNPVLLKPRGDGESQLVVGGRARGDVAAGEYYAAHWAIARDAAEAAYRRLASEHELVIAEGAGSIAEINLHDRDLANVETARFADAAILLVVDIERGGAFASLYGTLELLPPDLRERVVGAVITKFRGDERLLEPGIAEIESRTDVPILGVLPYDDPGLPEEDSVALPDPAGRALLGDDDGVPPEKRVTIGVPRLPRLANATDLEALASVPGVRVEYVPVDGSIAPFDDADAVVLPGTKNTVDDLRTLRAAGFADALAAFDGPIVGLCGGYQLLGERITNAALEGTGAGDVRTGARDVIEGFGLLPVETTFEAEKRLERTTVPVDGDATPLLSGADGTASGYEIHAGRTRPLESVARPLGDSSAARGNVLGTYLHGLFDNENVRNAFLSHVAAASGVASLGDAPGDDGPTAAAKSPAAGVSAADTPYDRASALVRDHVDLDFLDEGL